MCLPDWFPLPIYKQDLTQVDWLTEIALRAGLQTAAVNRRGKKRGRLNIDDPPEDTFIALFVTRKSRANRTLVEPKKTNFWPVLEPTPFELFFLVENQRTDEYEEAERWAKKLNTKGAKALAEFTGSGVRDRLAQMDRVIEKEPPGSTYLDVLGKRAAVMIDLDQDDETLELAFKVWLAGARDVLSHKAAHPIGDKEFSKWKKFGLLAAFDLTFWAESTGSRFTDAFLARAIWPDDGEEFVDLTERFRKVTRPMVAEVFNWDYVSRFWRQTELASSLDALVGKHSRA